VGWVDSSNWLRLKREKLRREREKPKRVRKMSGKAERRAAQASDGFW
jgi:hypothetical protein